MAAIDKSARSKWSAVVTLVCVFVAIDSARAAPAFEESECEGQFTRVPVTVTTQLLVGTQDDPSYRITWRLPALEPLSTIVRPPPANKKIGFTFQRWQGYVDQNEGTARLSTAAGMEEVKLACRRTAYDRPQKRR